MSTLQFKDEIEQDVWQEAVLFQLADRSTQEAIRQADEYIEAIRERSTSMNGNKVSQVMLSHQSDATEDFVWLKVARAFREVLSLSMQDATGLMRKLRDSGSVILYDALPSDMDSGESAIKASQITMAMAKELDKIGFPHKFETKTL